MFKDNNKDTRTTPDGAFCKNSQHLSAVNYFRKKFQVTLLWYIYNYVEHLSQVFNSVSIVEFEKANFWWI